MATATGVVKKINGNTAEILINRETMCGDGCSNCGLCSENKTKITALNDIGTEVDDCVEVSVETSFSIAAAALVYGVPLVLLFVGLALMTVLKLSEGIGLLCAGCAIAVWFIIMSVLDKKGKFKKYSAKVVRKL